MGMRRIKKNKAENGGIYYNYHKADCKLDKDQETSFSSVNIYSRLPQRFCISFQSLQ